MKHFIKVSRAFGAALLIAAMAMPVLSMTACTTSNGAITIDTTKASKLITAAAYAGKVIEGYPAIVSHMTDAQKAQFDTTLANVQTMAAKIAGQTDGSVTLALGANWPTDLLNDLQTLLSIAQPIATQFYPPAVTYITTTQALIPLIEAFLPAGVAPPAGLPVGVGVKSTDTVTFELTLAKIYAPAGSTVAMPLAK